jgi:predicted O-linked N-acetylglucosamine transferase (SPINDLY family)
MADWQWINAQLLQVRELMRRRRHAEAETLCRELLQIAPEAPDAWYALGAVGLQLGKPSDAESALRQAIALFPTNAAYHGDLSLALNRQGRFSAAEAAARQALAIDSQSAAYWGNLANALFAQRMWREAVAAYRQSLTLDPRNPAAWNNLAAAEQKLGNLAAAQEAFERSLAIAPHHLGARANYACLLFERGEHEQAVAILQDSLERAPQAIEAYLLIGYAFMRLGKPELALTAYRRAVTLSPRHRESRYNLALALEQTWSLAESESILRELLSDDPAYADAWALLSGVLQAECRMDEARAALQRSVDLAPNASRHSRLLHNLQYADDADPLALLQAHRQFDALYARPLFPAEPPVRNAERGDRPLRLGFVSADFRRHPTGFLVLPGLEQLDKSRCWIACYAEQLYDDQYTARFRAIADAWRTTVELEPAEVAELIRQDEIDVLVDLMGHTGKNHLLVFARKPAPMQVTWFGHVGTTGLSAMDFLLADRFHVRPGEEGHHVESILRMPGDYACYQAPPDAPAVAPLPALTAGHITFGCFNSPAKISRRTFDAWAAILRQVPTARLLLKYGALGEAHVQAWIRQQFAQRGVGPERILTEGWSPHYDLLAAYNRVDMALDTQPYSGGLTTCEALWMGVPIITYPGPTFASRHSESHLTNAGYEQFVATDQNAYISLAVTWANRLEELAGIRAAMRERVRQSALCDAKAFATKLLAILEQAWKSHHNHSPGSSA